MKSHLCRSAATRLLIGLCFVFSQVAYAQKDERFEPNIKPSLQLKRITAPIQVDGDLRDAGWQQASLAENYTEFQPLEGRKAPIHISSWITYDLENLYVAFSVKDDPSKIRARQGKRDEVFQDDWVAITLDTFGNNAFFLLLGANPYGIQVDTRNNGNNDDESYNALYTSAGKVTADGYQVEMSIPFKSLNFPNKDVQTWKANLLVNHPRENRALYTWASVTQNNSCFICQFGEIKDLTGIRPTRQPLQVMPSLVGSNEGSLSDTGDPTSTFSREKLGLKSFEPSLNLKYNLNSNTTAELTFNPDFSQIEADADQISVNTTMALFYSERRPFFQEGGDLYSLDNGFNFGEMFMPIYTRTINNPLLAGKFTGRFGQTNVGYIVGVDENSPVMVPLSESSEIVQTGRSVSNILRLKQNLKGGSYIGGMLSDRRMISGGNGSLGAIDGNIFVSPKHQVFFQLYGNSIKEINDPNLSNEYGLSGTFNDGKHTVALDGESFTGYATKLGFTRTSRTLQYYFGYDAMSPTFRADNGFVSQNNFRQLNAWGQYQFYPKNSFFVTIRPQAYTGKVWDFAGNHRDQYLGLSVNGQMKGQTWFNLGGQAFSNETFRGKKFFGMQRINMNVNTNFSQKIGGGFYTSYGEQIRRSDDPTLGLATNAGFWLNLRPSERFRFTPEINFATMKDKDTSEELYKGYVLLTTMNYQFSKAFSLRLNGQYNDFSKGMRLQPLMTYQINPFSVFYVGANWNSQKADSTQFPNEGLYTTNNSVFFKFQYLFNI